MLPHSEPLNSVTVWLSAPNNIDSPISIHQFQHRTSDVKSDPGFRVITKSMATIIFTPITSKGYKQHHITPHIRLLKKLQTQNHKKRLRCTGWKTNRCLTQASPFLLFILPFLLAISKKWGHHPPFLYSFHSIFIIFRGRGITPTSRLFFTVTQYFPLLLPTRERKEEPIDSFKGPWDWTFPWTNLTKTWKASKPITNPLENTHTHPTTTHTHTTFGYRLSESKKKGRQNNPNSKKKIHITMRIRPSLLSENVQPFQCHCILGTSHFSIFLVSSSNISKQKRYETSLHPSTPSKCLSTEFTIRRPYLPASQNNRSDNLW